MNTKSPRHLLALTLLLWLASQIHAPATSPAATNPNLDWPAGQAFPHFAQPAPTLDAIATDDATMTPDEKTMFTVLQGLVNKQQPAIYLFSRGPREKTKWPRPLDLKLKEYTANNKWQLLQKYKDRVKGVILYSVKKSPHYRNLACTSAGLKDALPVTDALYAELLSHHLEFPVLEDLRNLPYARPDEIYKYLHDHYWKDCTKRLLVSHIHPAYIRDIAAATGAATIWLDPRESREAKVLRLFLNDMKAGESIILGWWPNERSGVGIGTEYGISTVAADFYENSTVLAGMSHDISPPPAPPKPPLENKIYVAIFLSEGDNLQYCQAALADFWKNKARGAIPVNWTISPALVDLGPGLLNYYYKTATPNDCLVSGPSGLGYLLPYDELGRKWNNKGGEAFDAYAKLTGRYMEKSGLRVITVWDRLTESQRKSLAANCPYIYGVTQQDWGKTGQRVPPAREGANLSFVPVYPCYSSSVDEMIRKNRNAIASYDGKKPVFIAMQCESWKMRLAGIAELKARLEGISKNFIFCRADHFFALYNEAHPMDSPPPP